MASDTHGPFALNEKVLCYHGPLMYEAKVIQVGEEDGKAKYKVHYKGWKQTWDEWVPADRILPFTDDNLEKQKAQQKNGTTVNKAQAKAPAAGTSTRTGREKVVNRGQKRAHDEENGPRQAQMKLTVPETLKCQLVDDWEAVTKNQSTVTLNRDPNVQKILADFEKYVIETKPPSLKDPDLLTHTVVSGIQIYFDRSLGTQLLYRFERVQYSKIREQHWTGQHVKVENAPDLSMIYGAEHLLRMLVALPQMVAQSSLDSESTLLLRDYINELLIYMANNKDSLFQKEYDTHGVQYQNLARS